MGFWIFTTITNLLIPVTMLLFGMYFAKNSPKEINNLFGYRTPMSTKNKDTWNFAHQYCGKLWRILGAILLLISFIPMLFLIGKDTEVIETFAGVISVVQVIVLLLSIIPTEVALKRTFDKNGNRKDIPSKHK